MAKVIKTDPDKRYRRVLSASTLSSDSVKNRADEDLGKIKELMIDIPSGRVAYAVLSFGGFLGMGDKLFAVPWDALTLDEDRKCFVLDADKAKLCKLQRQTFDRIPAEVLHIAGAQGDVVAVRLDVVD